MEGNSLRSAAAADDLSSVGSSDSLLSGEAMEGNSLRPAAASDDLSSVVSSVGSSDSLLSGEAMEGNNLCSAAASDDLSSVGSFDDWSKQIRPGARQGIVNCIVNHIMDTLKGYLPISVPEALNELKKIVVRFEEKIYTTATTQSDYLRKISLKMLSMENKNPGATVINPSLSNPTIGNQSPSDSEFINLLSSEANEVCNREDKRTIAPEHFLKAFEDLGFGEYIEEVYAAYEQHRIDTLDSPKGVKFTRIEMTEEQAAAEQQRMFAEARARMNNGSSVHDSDAA